ncbi:DUF1932 domain-containing protein [Kineococcus aurantiacus]|uniref:Putative 4-hydroxy-4-methyl-2-oxoglutarate aldolase n=1 Tax=Kineococcus aurantiacus TaxID=37633 RepID=A0A7Y9DMM9_9ACTN|nr:DUF1932 domain-containing protein [Kineococcus aurantiacus]NYD23419.1 RraA family protein [Kineococcus aurantiacus]
MHVTVLGLGEAGTLYATGLTARGWSVSGYDPADTPTPAGVERRLTPQEAVRDADFVLSLVGGKVAERAAGSVAEHLPPSAVYLDMNAGDPRIKTAIAEVVGAARFADVSVVGSVPAHGSAAPVVISGEASATAARLFTALGADVEDIGGRPGDAAARKLLRSAFMKGLGALVVEVVEAGRAAGADEWVREQIAAELDGGHVSLERLHSGTRKHALRRAGETEASADLLDAAGLVPTMTRAAAQVHRRLADEALLETDDLLAQYEGLAVANIGDARERTGLMDSGIHALWKGARVVGRARTVRTRAGDNKVVSEALTRARPGDVLVIDGQGDVNRALIGELIAERARTKGVVGMVIDGAARDVGELERIGFGVWARAVSPAGPYKNGPGRFDVPVCVGGLVVHPGDLVVADDDGVVVVPSAEVRASLLGGRAVEADEAGRRAAILGGGA